MYVLLMYYFYIGIYKENQIAFVFIKNALNLTESGILKDLSLFRLKYCYFCRQGGHFELAERMVELVYEVTDRLAYYLCNKKPDHAAGQHYINLDKTDSNEMTDIAKAARGKLQLVSNIFHFHKSVHYAISHYLKS